MVHVILDNYAAHKHPKVRAWLDRHERFVFHFTPTSCSWLNAVEGSFARLSRRRLKRGVFRSVVDLQAAINRTPNRSPSHGPQTPNFRSWLLEHKTRDLARRTLSSFHSVLIEMKLQGCLQDDPAAGLTIRSGGRYEDEDSEVEIPSDQEVRDILAATEERLHGQVLGSV